MKSLDRRKKSEELEFQNEGRRKDKKTETLGEEMNFNFFFFFSLLLLVNSFLIERGLG
jgi:hypothetical protein